MNAKRKLGVMDGWELKCPVFLNLAAENVIVSVTVVLGPGPVTTCNIVTTLARHRCRVARQYHINWV